MAAKPNIRFMTTKTGRVHVVTTPGNDRKNSKCGVVKANHGMSVATGGWGKKKGISPEAALEMLDCAKCHSHEVAEEERKARMTPAQKRAAAKAQARETQVKLSGKKEPTRKSRKAEVKRRGPKGGDANGRMKANVEEHAAFAEERGWEAKAWNSDTNEWTCEAHKSGETLKIIWRDGRTVWARVVLATGVEVRLRNSSNWRKHASGKSGIKPDRQPRQRRGKKAARSQVINDDAPRAIPFNLDTDDHDTIIESLVGKTITWRNGTTGGLDVAKVPMRSRNCRVTIHPKSFRPMISFHESQGQTERGELLGGERTVYLDKILKAL